MMFACIGFIEKGNSLLIGTGKLINWAKAGVSAVLIVLAMKQATGSGRYGDVETLKIDPKRYSQYDIRAIFPGMDAKNRVLIVTNQGCEACEVALSHFRDWKLSYYSVNVAQLPAELRGISVMTPTIMELDDHNRISRIVVGWPAESIMAERLRQQLAEK